MSTVLLIGPDRRSEWNRFVTRHSPSHFMQLYEWGEVRESSGWVPHHLALVERGEITAGALVLERRIPGLGALLYSPRGPLWAPGATDHVRALATGARQLGRSCGAILWRVDPYLSDGQSGAAQDLLAAGFREVDLQWSYWNQPRYIMRLDTSAGKDRVLAAMDRNDRYKVRHSAKHGVKFEQVAPDEQQLGAFFGLMQATARKKRIPLRDRAYFSTLLSRLGPGQHAALFIARKDDKAVSTGISVKVGKTAWLMYLASDYSVNRASWGLQWEMVSWAIDAGCDVYDFRGSATNFPPHPSDKGYGVYKFKQSFGASLVPLLGYYDLVLRPAAYRFLIHTERRLLPLGERLLDLLAMLRARSS